LPFGDVKGTHFTEVKRVFNNGLRFDTRGYQLEPSWKLYFISDDSVNVFSLKTKRYYGFHVYFDHDSIFNMVGVWFKLKKIATDSLWLQALRVENKIIKDDDEGSKVYLTFYSERYIKSHPDKNITAMGLPDKRDTAFIRQRSALANSNIDSAFAARQPVTLTSNSPSVKVEKVEQESTPLQDVEPGDVYLAPEFNITIHKAYENFSYVMCVYVDANGKMIFSHSAVPLMPEFKASYEQVMRGIVDGYLQHYLRIVPGTTLGIAHTSSILLNVNGKTN
jgi:hypothetical protein